MDGGVFPTADQHLANHSRAEAASLADLATVPGLSSGSLEAYIASIARIPYLDAATEAELARRWRDGLEVPAAQKLVLSNLRFVVYVARRYLGYGLPLADLIQEGNIGLMKAIRRFDPERGVRLISLAVHWIRAEIHEYIIRNWRIVKIATTSAQRKLFFRLRGLKQHPGWMNRAEVDAVAKELAVTSKEVMSMESRLAQGELSFNSLPTDEEHSRGPEAYLSDEHDDYAELEAAQSRQLLEERMKKALAALDERSRQIVARRWLHAGKKAQLRELAEEYGVSAERVRQIQSQAFAQMRATITSPAALAA